MPLQVQNIIHKFEEGSGAKWIKIILGVIMVAALAALYNLAAYKNFSAPEAMDAAQLGRRLAQGHGFTTDFIRPFSLYLLQAHHNAGRPDESAPAATVTPDSSPSAAADASLTNSAATSNAVPARAAAPPLPPSIKPGAYPDISQPPLYPLLLAGLLTVAPQPKLAAEGPRDFSVYLPELWIAIGNQFLLLVAITMIYILGRRLFDERVGTVAAAVVAGADLFWRFSVSGLPILLLTVIFLAIVLLLSTLEPAIREEGRSRGWHLMMCAFVGILVGLGGLTRYAFAWILIPVVLFLVAIPGRKTGSLATVAVAAACLVMAPWVARNMHLTGTPFGTAGFAVFQGAGPFQNDLLERSLHPPLSNIRAAHFKQKLLAGTKRILTDELPDLAHSWVPVFFLAGLLVPFRNPTLRALRGFTLASLLIFLVVQALGRVPPEGKPDLPDPNNLLILAAPLVFLFGVSFFFILLDQSRLAPPPGRYVAIGAFVVVTSFPLILTLFTPVRTSLAYPPYYPPWVAEKSSQVAPGQTIMSDIPWAVAWYGQRPSVWLSLQYKNDPSIVEPEDFAAVDERLPVSGLYLSGRTIATLPTESWQNWRLGDPDMDLFVALRQRLIANWQSEVQDTREIDFQVLASFRKGLFENWTAETPGDVSWESFIAGVVAKLEVPSGFPLERAHGGVVPEIFLTDSEQKKEKDIQSE